MNKNNKQYFFILGRNPELSIAEIVSLLKESGTKFALDLAIDSVLIISSMDLPDGFFERLGGSKKFGEVKGKINSLPDIEMDNILGDYLKEDKFRFGFSFYNFSKNEFKKAQMIMYKQGLSYKKELKERGIKSRLVESREDELSSVIVHKEKMIDDGADIILIKYKEEIFYGKTLAVQDYNSFSARDYGKPGRDATSGMLPPKLARIMLNLATYKTNKVLLDPFCGSGTVILEALALKFKKIYGSDKSKVAVQDTETNLIWWQQRFVIGDIPEIKSVSVEQLGNKYDKSSIDIIVTEPYLGPPLRGRENNDQMKSIQNELQELYKIALQEFLNVLKPDGRIVMIWPVFVDKRGDQLFLNLKDKLDKLNLEIVNCLTDYDLSITQPTKYRQTYYYSREGQRVCREVVVLKRKN